MKALYSTTTLAGGLLLALGAPAFAQADDVVVLNIMRECAKIGDSNARLSCYDNNIRASKGSPAATPVQRSPAPSALPAAVAATPAATGFGSESIADPDRFETPAGEAKDLRSHVASSRERQPGIYLITLDDGAQWLFSESAGSSFRPPRKGDEVEIRRASMGSFLLSVDGQPSVRARRTK